MRLNLPSFSLSTILDVNEVEIVSAVPWKKSTNGTISNNFNIEYLLLYTILYFMD